MDDSIVGKDWRRVDPPPKKTSVKGVKLEVITYKQNSQNEFRDKARRRDLPVGPLGSSQSDTLSIQEQYEDLIM